MLSDAAPTFWEVVATIVGTLATVALAFFGAVQLYRERHRIVEAQRAANARVSAIAYQLRRQIRSWLGIEPPHDGGLESWVADAITLKSLSSHLDRAEKRATELVILAPDASPEVARELHEAYVLFLAATNRINERAATPRPSGEGEMDWIQLIPDAEQDLKECLAALESAPISAYMLNAEAILRRTREEENPIHQLAEGLARLHKGQDSQSEGS